MLAYPTTNPISEVIFHSLLMESLNKAMVNWGIGDSAVAPNEEDDEVKSVGHSMTLRQDVSKREDILKSLLQLIALGRLK